MGGARGIVVEFESILRYGIDGFSWTFSFDSGNKLDIVKSAALL